MRFWIDVEDLFVYARSNARPSGIQRVAFMTQEALEARAELCGRITYVRHTPDAIGFRVVPRDEVRSLYTRMVGASDEAATMRLATRTPPRPDGRARQIAQRLPTTIRVPLGTFLRDQAAAIKAGASLISGLTHVAGDMLVQQRKKRRPDTPGAATGGGPDAFVPDPGDVVLALGAPWSSARYDRMLARYRDTFGVRVAILIHDVIPLIYPEWCSPGLGRVFARWYEATLPVCDHILVNSQTTRRDLIATAAARGVRLTAQVTVIPMGTPEVLQARPETTLSPELTAHPFVLVVGTIEARKNHAMLLRVWRRLMQERHLSPMPKLVFAGREGWLVADLMQQLRNSNYLDGHVIIAQAPSDAEVEALYRHAMMTIVPSHYEGWGLPVSESQARGCLCVVSTTPALREAAGADAPMFDPDNVTDAVRVIGDLVSSETARADATRAMRASYVPVPWSATAQAIVTALTPEA